MSANVDDRIVRMQFDSTGFEAGAAKVLNTLDKLGAALNFEGASAGLDNVRKSIGNLDMEPVANAVDVTKEHFSALEQIGVGALRKLGEQAVELGERLLKNLGNALTRSARDGFSEYQQQINSTQTIAANSGEALDVITENLNTLNKYADKTSYNFTDMTSAIGRFTAAGLGVEASTVAIQGFFNAAALSGADKQAAARGIYQLSQAMSAGVVKLQDWKSIENASIDTENFRQIIMKTAEHMGVVDKKFKQAANGTMSFRESLSSGWLTADIMQAALENLTMSTLDFEDAENGRQELMKQLVAQGYSEEVAGQIIDIATAADSSAREIRTFQQLMDTINESMGSGWAETWKLIVGDLNSATEFFTWLGNRFGDVISASADARNAVVKDWVDSGGRDALIGGITNIIEAVQRVMDVVGDAFSGVFGVSGKQLAVFTENIALFTEKLVMSEETMNTVHNVLFDFFTIIKSVIGILGNGIRIVVDFASAFFSGFSSVKKTVSGTDTFLTPLAKFLNKIHVATDKVADGFAKLIDLLNRYTHAANNADIQDADKGGLFGSSIKKVFDMGKNFKKIFDSYIKVVKAVSSGFLFLGQSVLKLLSPFKVVVEFIGTTVLNAFTKFLKMMANLIENSAAFWDSFITGIIWIARPIISTFEIIERAIIGFFGSLYKGFMDSSIGQLFGGILSSIVNAITNFKGDFSFIKTFIWTYIASPLWKLRGIIARIVSSGDTEALASAFRILITILGGPLYLAIKGAIWVFERLSDVVKGPLATAWNWLVDKFKNANWSNPFSGIADAIANVKIPNPFEKFGIPEKLAIRIDKIKTKLTELGTSADDARFSLGRFMKQAGAKIKTSGKNGLDSVVKSVKDTWTRLKTYFTDLSQNGNTFSQNIVKLFSDAYNSMKSWVHSIAEGTEGFGGTIARGFEFVLEQIEKVPGLIRKLFGETEKATKEGAKKVTEGAKEFKENQKTFWSGIKEALPSFAEIGGSLSEFFGNIKRNLSDGLKNLVFGSEEGGGLKASLASMFDFSNVKIVLPDFASPIEDAIEQFNSIIAKFDTKTLSEKVEEITNMTKQGGGILAAFSGFRLINAVIRKTNSQAKKNEGLGELFSQWPEAFKGAFQGLAKGLGENAGKEVGGGLKALGDALKEFGKSFTPFARKQPGSKSFLQVAEGILLLAGALLVLSKIPADDLERVGEAMLKILGISAGFTFVAAYLSAMTKLDLKGVGLAMAGLGIALMGIAGAVYLFTKMVADENFVVAMYNFKLVLEILALAMGGLMIASYGSNLKGVAVTLLALTAAITLSIVPILLLGLMPKMMFNVGSERLKSLMFFYAMCGGFLEVVSSVASPGGLIAASVALIGLAAVATLSIIPITLFSLLPEKYYKTGRNRVMQMAAFFGAVETLMGFIIRNGAGALKATIAMIPLIAAVTLALIPVAILGVLPVENVAQGELAVVALGSLLGVLVGLFNLISVNVLTIAAAAVGMTLMVIPLTAMAVVVTLLSAVAAADLDSLKAAVDTFYNIVVVIASMALIGVLGGGGLLALSFGLIAVSAALAILASAIDAINVQKFVNDINALLTGMAEAGANAVIGFIDGITGGLGTAFKTGVQMALEFLNGLRGPEGIEEGSPSKKTEESGQMAAEGFINGVMSYFGLTESTGEETGTTFLDGVELADLPGKLAKTAADAVNTFVSNVDVNAIVKKGTDIATGLVNGIIDNIHTDELVQKGNEITAGLVDGLGSDAAKELVAFPGKVFSAIVDGIKGLFGIQSPSTVMKEEVGFNILQGLIDGLGDGSLLGSLGEAVLTIGQSILTGLTELPGWLKTKAEEGIDWLTGGFTSKSGEVEASGKDVGNKAVDGVKTLPDDMKKKAVEGAIGLATGLGSKVSEIRNASQQNVTAAKQPTNTLSSDMRTSGASGGQGLADGIYSKRDAAYGAGSSLSYNAKSGVGSLYDSMHSAGSNGAQGLIDGLRSKVRSVANQAIELAQTAVNNALSTLKVNSPSKVFIGIGESVGEGFVMGIADQTRAVAKSSSKLAGTIPSTFTDTLDKMSYNIDDILNTEYNPVISPVIDPTTFNADLSNLTYSLNNRLASDVAMGTFNYNETFAGKFDDMTDVNRQAMKAFAENAIDYNLLGQSVANALIRSGVHVEMDGGQLMGYLAGEIQDARRMYR